MRMLAVLLGVGLGIVANDSAGGSRARAGVIETAAELFRLDKVWDVELSFSRDQWRALQPTPPAEMDGLRLLSVGDGGRSTAGTNRVPGGASRLALGAILGSPAFRTADTDRDGTVTAREFEHLGGAWFDAWDLDHSGALNEAKIQAGIERVLRADSGGLGSSGEVGSGLATGFSASGPEGRRNGLSGARGIEFNYVHADLKFDGELIPDVAVRYKGNATYVQSVGQAKRPLKIDLNEFIKGQKLAGVVKLNFHNSITDASWMNEALAYRLYRDAGVPAPRVGYARVRLNAPLAHTNTALGLYTVVENVDAHFAEEVLGSKKGLLLKPSTSQLFRYLGEDWEKYKPTYDPKTPVYASQAKRVISFCKLLTEADDATFAAQAADYVDFDEVSRFLAVTVWISTLDSILGMGQNFVVHLHPKSNKLQLMPWDLDHAFGQFGLRGSQEEREQLSIRAAWNPEVRFLNRLMKVPAFEEAYLARLREFQGDLFKPDRLSRQVDEVAAVIRESVKLDGDEKLARFDKVVGGEAVPMLGSGGNGPAAGSRNSGGPLPKPIKGFVPVRYASVAAQLAGTSNGKKLSSAADPARVTASRFLALLDENHDQSISRAEFTGRFSAWFTAWDKEKKGAISEETLRQGLADVFKGKPD